MTIEEKLKDFILARYGTLKDFTPHTGLSYSTVDTILRRGLKKASISNVISICRALGLSADELANGRIVPIGGRITQQTQIEEILNFAKSNIGTNEKFTLDGEPLSANELEKLIDGMEIVIELIRRNRGRENK